MNSNDNFTWTEDTVTTTIETGTMNPMLDYRWIDYA